jgi:hypothetical protein
MSKIMLIFGIEIGKNLVLQALMYATHCLLLALATVYKKLIQKGGKPEIKF